MAPAGMTAHDFTGMLRFDRRHQWMVATMRGAWGNNPVLGLFSFDSASGTVGSGTLVPVESPWGVEFSCDGSFFYLSHNISNPIHQFNMLAGSPADILASGVGVSPPYVAVFDMMVGPDNRIYFIWNDAWNRGAKVLGAIMHPGSAGTGCVVVDSAIVWIDPYAANSTGLPSFQQPASGPAMSCSTPTRVSAHGFSEEAPRLESTVVVDGTWVRWTSAYAGYSIDVVDAAGRQLRSFRTSGQEHWLDARGLGSGIYILRVTDA